MKNAINCLIDVNGKEKYHHINIKKYHRRANVPNFTLADESTALKTGFSNNTLHLINTLVDDVSDTEVKEIDKIYQVPKKVLADF